MICFPLKEFGDLGFQWELFFLIREVAFEREFYFISLLKLRFFFKLLSDSRIRTIDVETFDIQTTGAETLSDMTELQQLRFKLLMLKLEQFEPLILTLLILKSE